MGRASWAFIALCRQLDINVGLLVVPVPPEASTGSDDATTADAAPDQEPASPRAEVWICVALIDGVPYLFDCRLGMPVPGPGGEGVATLEQAATDPTVLTQLDLPGHPYPMTAANVASDKVLVWIDSTLGNLSTRMRELQEKLAGRNRMILYRDPSEVDAAFDEALGDRFGGTDLWPMPMEVEFRLFNDPQFVESTQYAIYLFDSKLPLLPARIGQLNGQLDASVQSYVGFRFADRPVQNNGKDPIPPQVQQLLDLYATYYLGLAKLDQGKPEQAKRFFEQTLTLLAETDPNEPPLAMFPYITLFAAGARTNLGLIDEAQGKLVEAVRHYNAGQPTKQQDHGNRLRALDLIWRDPFVPDAPPASKTIAISASEFSPDDGQWRERHSASMACPMPVEPGDETLSVLSHGTSGIFCVRLSINSIFGRSRPACRRMVSRRIRAWMMAT